MGMNGRFKARNAFSMLYIRSPMLISYSKIRAHIPHMHVQIHNLTLSKPCSIVKRKSGVKGQKDDKSPPCRGDSAAKDANLLVVVADVLGHKLPYFGHYCTVLLCRACLYEFVYARPESLSIHANIVPYDDLRVSGMLHIFTLD